MGLHIYTGYNWCVHYRTLWMPTHPHSTIYICKHWRSHSAVNKHCYLDCCFTMHFGKYKTILPTKALFLLKHKMLQFVFKISPYMATTCFGPFRPSSGSIRWNLAKVTVSLKSSVKGDILNTNCSILCFNKKKCICWQNSLVLSYCCLIFIFRSAMLPSHLETDESSSQLATSV